MQLENNTHKLIYMFLWRHLESKSNFVPSGWAKAKRLMYVVCVSYHRVDANERGNLNLHSPKKRCIAQRSIPLPDTFGTK